MSWSLKQIAVLDKQIKKLEQMANKKEGQLSQLRKQLKKDHGVQTVKQAKQKIAAMEKEIRQLESDLSQSLGDLKKDHKKWLP